MQNLGVHEKLELHEIMNFKTLCLTKSQTALPMVTDERLKNILQQDIASGREDISEIKNLLV